MKKKTSFFYWDMVRSYVSSAEFNTITNIPNKTRKIDFRISQTRIKSLYNNISPECIIHFPVL